MKEYFKEPGKTTKAIDSEGFLHTGDIGSWDSVSHKNCDN